jgi:hypothetical protein
LEREGLRYTVSGGGALNLLGLARFTKDLDLFIGTVRLQDRADAEALRQHFGL